MERVCRLEGTVSVMEGELAVARNVNTLLSRQLDEASSYSRRSCMIFMGSPKVRECWNKWWWRFKRNIGEDRRKWFQEASRQNTSHRWCKKWKPTENYKIHYSYLRGESTSQHKPNKKMIMEKGKRIQNTSPRCDWTFGLLYHVTELTCLEKPMRRLKVMRTSNLLMPICMVIWSSH